VSDAVLPPVNSRAIVFTEIEAMGGAERAAFALSRWLAERDLAHHFVTYVDHVGIATTVDRAIEVVQLRPEMRVTKKVAALKKYFAARRAGPKPLMSGFQPALHASLAGIKGFHCLMHDTPSLFEDGSSLSLKGRVNRWVSDKIAARGLKSGGRTIVTSEYLRKEVRRVYGVDAEIARMGGLSGANAFRLRPVGDALRMLSVSRIESNKRIDWMMRALAEMERGDSPLSSRVDWTLDIAGRGSQMDAMQKMASSLGLTERIRFLGYVSDAELEKLYDEAHLFLMPAVQGYGIPAIEAISRGLPVLLHRESGVSDILLETPWATVIDGGEENMLPGLQRAIHASLDGVSLTAPLPVLPTEDAWAERVATLCGWV
jgi:glycosyltransferase involved in cell wall biosynthesis